MNIKKSQLKEVIKQIVRQTINERKYGVNESDKSPNVRRTGQLNPKVLKGEKKPSASYAKPETNPIRKAGKLGFGLKQEAGLTSEHGGYDEGKELELIKQIGQKVLELLAMHSNSVGVGAVGSTDTDTDDSADISGLDTDSDSETEVELEPTDNTDMNVGSGDGDVEVDSDDGDDEQELDEASYKVVAPNQVDTSKENKARTIQTDPKVSENFKVQTGPSYRTSNDNRNNPKNVRNPKLG